jgi:hypothetical protein
MKAIIISTLLCSAAFASGCKKEKAITTDASVTLTALTYYKDNHDETRTDRSGAWSKTSYYSIVTESGTSKLFITLGEQGTAQTQAVFGIGFTFSNISLAENIPGTYSFPSANQFVKVVLRNQIMPGRDETVLLPVFGKVSFSYDTAAKKISGRIENLEFNLLGYAPFDRNKIIINGTFEKISLK